MVELEIFRIGAIISEISSGISDDIVEDLTGPIHHSIPLLAIPAGIIGLTVVDDVTIIDHPLAGDAGRAHQDPIGTALRAETGVLIDEWTVTLVEAFSIGEGISRLAGGAGSLTVNLYAVEILNCTATRGVEDASRQALYALSALIDQASIEHPLAGVPDALEGRPAGDAVLR